MENKILVETSARHIHLTDEAVEVLFGAGHILTKKKDLSQPGQYACEEKVEVVGPKSSLKMSVLGPTRPESQVELSFTDARTIGVSAPVRESGDVAGTPGITLRGPAGEVTLENGVIIAKRHIHITPEDAESLGVADKEIVKVKITSDGRSTIYDDVVIRVKSTFATAMHIDTDECNAAGAFGVVYGEIVK
ncbi:MAG: phosphate propanoyltransferase [Clostridia bacterium]|nr:phosphate propanoyltransferase [Clostridia bacterium]